MTLKKYFEVYFDPLEPHLRESDRNNDILDTVSYFPEIHFAFHIVHRVLLLRMHKRYSRLSAQQLIVYSSLQGGRKMLQ